MAAKKKKSTQRLTAAVTRDEDMYVAQCLEVDVASQGDTVEDALANLTEALELYFEDSDFVPSAAPIIAPLEVKLRRAG
jgi:predicted RNase H-like HicB family nuclease